MKSSLDEIFFTASRLGVVIGLAPGGLLEVGPAERVPPWFVAVVRDHKDELVTWLQARAARHHVVRQVLDGDFDFGDRSTVNRVAEELQALMPSSARNVALMRLVEGARK